MRLLAHSLFLAIPALFATSALAEVNSKQLYGDLVAPVLAAKCGSCHGEEKQKGKLRVDSFEAIMKGGSEGASVVAGDPNDSPLVLRVYLPLDDDEHMPPENKEQLTDQETELLTFWIKSGAKAEGTVAEFKPDEKMSAAIAHVAGNLPKAETTVAKADAPRPADPERDKLVAETIGNVQKTGASLMAIAQDTPELRFSALNVSKDFKDDDLAALKPVSEDVKWIDLARTPVTDKGIAHLAGMKNLTKLHLENTKVTDAALDTIKNLPNLEYLNLYGTAVTDAGIAKLAGMKNLKKVFLWQSKVTDAGAEKLSKAIPGVDVNTGWKAPAAKPVVVAAAAPAAKPATPAPAKPAPKPAPKPATKPDPKPAPAVDPMFEKALSELKAAADAASKKAAAKKGEFDTAIKAVAEATKKAEALKASSEKAAKVAAETKAALDQLQKAVESNK